MNNKHLTIDSTDYPEVLRITYEDGSQIWYYNQGKGIMLPGYLYRVLCPDNHTVDLFIPFGLQIHPFVLRISHG